MNTDTSDQTTGTAQNHLDNPETRERNTVPATEMTLRLSIQPTYDSRKTGPRFSVETLVNGRSLTIKRIPDPFVRTSVSISIWGCLKSILLGGCFVEVRVSGDNAIAEDVLELDANYIGHGNTRRVEWNAAIESALKNHAEAPSVEQEGSEKV